MDELVFLEKEIIKYEKYLSHIEGLQTYVFYHTKDPALFACVRYIETDRVMQIYYGYFSDKSIGDEWIFLPNNNKHFIAHNNKGPASIKRGDRTFVIDGEILDRDQWQINPQVIKFFNGKKIKEKMNTSFNQGDR